MSDAGVAAVTRPLVSGRRPRWKRALWRLWKVTPLIFYVLIAYIIIEVAVPDVRAIFINAGPFKFTWVEFIYLVASLTPLFEIQRISKPGIDNTKENFGILAVWILYLVLFILSLTGVPFLSIFSTTEFSMLVILFLGQYAICVLVNARTLKKTIDYTSRDDASGFGEDR